MENFLRKMMQSAGKVVEKMGKMLPSKKGLAAPSVKQNKAETSISGQSFVPENLVRKWVESLEMKEIASFIPNLTGKNVLQATTSRNRLWDILQQKGAELVIDFDIGHFEGSPQSQKPLHIQMLRGDLFSSPFPKQSIDYFILLGAGIRRENPTEWMKEVSRVLKDGSRLIFCFMHPYLEYRFNPNMVFTHRFDEYFMAMKKAEIYVEEVREFLANDALKSSLGLAKNDKNFAQIKDFPMLLLFRGVRLKRR